MLLDVTALSSAEEICLATITRLFLANLRLFGASWHIECRAISSSVVCLAASFSLCHIF